VNSRTKLLDAAETEEGEDDGVLAVVQGRTAPKEEEKSPAPTTTSLDCLVSGFLADSTFAELVVDIRDSLFNTVFSEQKKSFDDLVKLAGKTLFWCARCITDLLNKPDKMQYIACLCPKSIVFGEGGRVVLVKLKSFFELNVHGEEKLKLEFARWNAPEMITCEVSQPNEKTAVFTLGMIAWCIMLRKIPFDKMEIGDVAQAIADGERPPLNEIQENKHAIESVITKAWDGYAGKRMKLSEVMEVTAAFFDFQQVVKESIQPTEDSEDSSSQSDNTI
jgi:hypothetical protein